MSQVSAIRKRIDALIAAKKYEESPPIDLIIYPEYELIVKRSDGRTLNYKPTPTLKKFHADQSLFRTVMGPYSSGKSVGCDADLMIWGAEMPNCLDGIKRSRFILVRNTYPDLQNTTVKTWLDWFGKVGRVRSTKQPPYFLQTINFERRDHEQNVLEKGIMEMELIFLSLDSYADVHKLDSIEATGFYFNEIRHIEWKLIPHALGRINRYPKAADLAQDVSYRNGIIADTNPPSMQSDFYNTFEIEKPNGFKLFKQPAALIKNDNGEWIENPLRENRKEDGAGTPAQYYFNQLNGAPQEFIKVHILGEYGSINEGKAVYNNYNDDIHAVDDIRYDHELPILIGMDGGLTPAAVLLQVTNNGYINVIREFCSEDLFLDSFLKNAMLPSMARDYPNYELLPVQLDPGTKRDEVSGYSPLIRLQELGIGAEKASTNSPLIRIDAVKGLLETLIGGKPRFRISKKGCPILREGFIRGYQFKKLKVVGVDAYSDEPDKNEFSHIHDALQYACLKIVTQVSHNKAPLNNHSLLRQGGFC